MALQVLNTTSYSAGSPVNLGTTDSVVIGRDGLALSTGNAAGVSGIGNNHWVMVEGTVAGQSGVSLGDDRTVDHGETVLITATGVAAGSTNGLFLNAYDCSVTNYGLVTGYNGIFFGGTNAGSAGSRLENAGIVQGSGFGVIAGYTEPMTILNTGTISGGINSVFGSSQDDSLRNLGVLIGDVDLKLGNDTYDGRGGSIEGTIFGRDGNDTFRVGAGVEVIDGGAGVDTLDFRLGGAIRVALDGSIANTKTAEDDTYSNIENLIGSRHGNDALTGDAVANALDGLGGKDTLSGGSGNDALTGGTGPDKLTGDLGDDRFVFNTIDDGSDTITDFRNLAGNDDAFLIAVAGFGGGLTAGVLAVFQFQARADNIAQDADDRFIFNTTDHTLWFDVNGSDAGGLTLLATLQGNTVLTAADILLG